MAILPEQTVHYKTYLKTALVEGLRDVFVHHIDEPLSHTKVTIEWPTTREAYPTIIVRFFERSIVNAGIGHVEYILREDAPIEGWVDKFKHYFYTGDIEFAIFALSSLDRDLISDSLVQTLGMGDLNGWTNRFLNRIYEPAPNTVPDSKWNYVNINTDEIQGFGESQTIAPWQPEDQLTYQTSYRVSTFGEFYSLPPTAPVDFIHHVNFYPYISDLEPVSDIGSTGYQTPPDASPVTMSDDPAAWEDGWS